MRDPATGRFVANGNNVLLFGPPGVGKTHLAIGLGRACVQAGYSVLFVTATELVAALDKAHAEGRLADRLAHYAKPKLLIIDELGYLPFDKRAANSSSSSSCAVTRRPPLSSRQTRWSPSGAPLSVTK